MKKSWLILFILLTVQIFVSFVGRGIAPIAPFIANDLQLTNTQVGMLPAAFYLGNILTSLPSGWFADQYGTKKMLLFVPLLIGLSFIGASLAPWYLFLLLFLAIGGAGYGAMHSVSNRGIIYWFPKRLAGTAMGIKQMGVTAGSALSFLILIPLSEKFNWNSPFAISALLLILIGIIGSLIYTIHPSEKKNGNTNLSDFYRSILLVSKNKSLVITSIAITFLTSAQLTILTYLAFFLSDILLYPIVLAGVFLAIFEIGGALGRLLWGLISDRLFDSNRTRVLYIVAFMTSVCSLLLIFVPPQFTLWLLMPLIFIFGFCIGGYNGIWMNVASECVDREFSGMATGLSIGLGTLGVIFGPPLFGYIVDVTGSFLFGWIFIIIQMIFVVAILIFNDKENYKLTIRLQNLKQKS